MVILITILNRKSMRNDMNNIKQVIQDSGYRKNWIAEQIGVKPSHISMWISGDRIASKPRIRMLCKILKCKVVDLFPKVEDGNG